MYLKKTFGESIMDLKNVADDLLEKETNGRILKEHG